MKNIYVILATLLLLIASPAHSGWKVSSKNDIMTGELSAFAISDWVPSVEPMGLPYNDVEAVLGVGCSGYKTWAYIRFTESPNILNDKTKDGYNLVPARLRWGSRIKKMVLFQEWGGYSLGFRDDDEVIDTIKRSPDMLLELKWYGEGATHFKFSLEGASEAIESALALCTNRGATK